MRRKGTMVYGFAAVCGCGLLLSGFACAADPKPAKPKEAKEADVKKMEAALPDTAPAKPEKPRKVLIYGLAKGFVHSSIPLGARTIEELGKKTGAYESTISYDPAAFEPENLKGYDAIVLVSTTGNFLDDPDKAVSDKRREALLNFVKDGKGLVGIHAATDAYYGWRDYGELTGGYFNGHPWNEKVGVKVDDPESPLTRMFDKNGIDIADEIYQFTPKKNKEGQDQQTFSRSRAHVLLSLDMTTPGRTAPKGKSPTNDFPVAWIQQAGQDRDKLIDAQNGKSKNGRVFYCSLGHREEIYWNPVILKFYLAGIQYALGDLQANAVPSGKSAEAPASGK